VRCCCQSPDDTAAPPAIPLKLGPCNASLSGGSLSPRLARVCRPNCAVCAAEVHRPVTRQRRQSSLSVRVHRLPLGAFSPLARSAWPRFLQKGRWPKAAQFLLVSATTGPRFVRFCAVCAAGGFVVSRHQRRQPSPEVCPLPCLGVGRYRVGA
jgi:hypothetical protein